MVYLVFAFVLIATSILLSHYRYDFGAAILLIIGIYIGIKGRSKVFKKDVTAR